MRPLRPIALSLLLALVAAPLWGQPPTTDSDPPFVIHRITKPIVVDGDLSDEGWKETTPITKWYETRPGDNIEPKVRNVAWLAYDDHFFYAAFEFDDPDPRAIKAPLGDHDHMPSYTDYGGVIVDPNNNLKTAQMFLANWRGVQYDAISSDASGEDNSPDFYWDAAGRITDKGWQLEIRIPFSTLRYSDPNPEKWNILLYRNRPREFRYQMFTSKLPRNSNCFICNSHPLVGLKDLPSGRHWVAAPYATASRVETPTGDLGTPLDSGETNTEIGLDAKWIPNPNTVIDGTINPDFSQIESDVAQISANERFALFFPERRPFFLEGIDLFSTPINALYTRTFTHPDWGIRATGTKGDTTYTALVGQDDGGGSVIIPGSNSSDFAPQDFKSIVAVGRVRRDFGQSFLSFLYSGREIDGGGSNRVFGPDFQWQPNAGNTVTGQLLFSQSRTPNRSTLADEWDGRTLSDYAGQLWWQFQKNNWDFFSQVESIGPDFRADNGFVPQVGYDFGYAEGGHTFYPKDKPVSRLRVFTFASYTEDVDGNLLKKGITPGFGLDSILNSFVRLELAFEDVRGIDKVFQRRQIRPTIQIQPGGLFSYVYLKGTFGDEIDYANDRVGDGTNISLNADIRPSDHLVLSLVGGRRTLDVTNEEGLHGRLFTAEIGRIKGVYTFTSRAWMRVIGQWSHTTRDPRLYTFDVDDTSGDFAGSAVLAYKINWQTVAYLGYADSRALDDTDVLQRADRQLFLKMSYAFQK